MNQPEHIARKLNELIHKIESQRGQDKSGQDEDQWIIDRGNEINDWFLEVFGDERTRNK